MAVEGVRIPMDVDFLMKRYPWELERKDKLTATVALPVTILTDLGGADVTMARPFPFSALKQGEVPKKK
jgi:hypothetical protein